ncbi:hypothetical protein CDFC105_53815 [Clostridioides difficile]|nr:hypothetical protein [Clostridioides difficile]CZR83065.1 hypothetical protein CDFC105_53815 [Clostridioides difficile]
MTFKELVNKVRNLVLEAKNVTIEDTESKFTSENVEGALKECIDRADEAFQEADSGKTLLSTAIGSPATKNNTFAELARFIGDRKKAVTGISEVIFDTKVFIKIDNSKEAAYYISIPNLQFKPSFVFAVSELYGTNDKGNESVFYINCEERKLLIFTYSTSTDSGYSKILNPNSAAVFEDFEKDKKMYLPIANSSARSFFI